MVTQTAASSSASLPPSWRDIEIYRLVKIEQSSTRLAAKHLQLSQTRVCQIVGRVGDFLRELLLLSDNDQDRQRDLLLAEQIAAERMEGLYGQTMRAFQRSQVQTVSVYEGDGEDCPPQITKRTNGGDARYLIAAARLALYQTKLPTPKLNDLLARFDDFEEETTEDVPEFDAEPTEPEVDVVSPPAEDCSVPAANSAVAAAESLATATAALDLDSTCVSGVTAELLAKLNEMSPVQPTITPPTGPNPASDPAYTQPTLTRKQALRKLFFRE